VIDRVSPGAVGTDGLSLRPGSDAFSVVVADVRLATAGLVLLATEHAVMGELTSRQCAEVPGELLSRRGYEITMADIAMMPSTSDDSVYLYAGRRFEVVSFLYIGESVRYAPADEIGVGLIRELIGVVNEERGSASILATTSFIASNGAESEQRFNWQLDSHEYAVLGEWLEAAHRVRDGG
jgi:hypothetical protein